MKDKEVISVVSGMIGGMVSYLLVDTQITAFGDYKYSYILLPIYIGIVTFLVFFRKPNIIDLLLRLVSYSIVYSIMIKVRIYDHYSAINSGSSFSVLYPKAHNVIVIVSIVILTTFVILSLIRIVLYHREK